MSAPTKPVPMDVAANPQPFWMTISGWILTVLLFALYCMSASFKLLAVPMAIEGWTKAGFKPEYFFWIGVLEVVCAVIYLFPRTAVLGAVLLAGYMGGAILMHVHQNEMFIPQIVIGMLVWLAIYLREPKLRQILPLR